MKEFAIVVLLVFGFIAAFYSWPKSIDLPNIGEVEEWTLAEVSGDMSMEEKT